MEILVCIKQVPDDSVEITLNKETGKPNLENITPVVNAFDTYALEMATRLKENMDGEIIALSIGDESVKNSLKNCLAVGADKAFFIENSKDLSALDVAKVLKCGKEKLESDLGVKFDVIFCGKESTDYATSQVGVILAEELQIPVITNVVDIKVEDEKIEAKQEIDCAYNIITAKLPSLLTVQKPDYEPRYPTIKTKMQARKKPIEKIEVAIPETATKILKVYEPQKREAGVKLKCATPEETIDEAIKIIVDAKVL